MIRKYLYISIVLASSLWFLACNNLEDSAMTIKPSEESLILSETFETSFGKFSTYNVSGDQIWTIDSRAYAGMSGYVVATKTNYANEDWLISPEIDLTNVTESYVTFDYVAHLMGDISQESTLWISENYITDSLPSKATWVQFPVKILPDPGNYVFSSCGQVSLNSFAGKKIKIAFKYVSTATKGGTWEIKNFQVKKGIAFNKDNGKGTELLPYNLAGAFANQGSAGAVSACVRGYIVGYLWSGTSTNFIFSSDTCTQATNILIADTVNGLYLSKCMPVQLPIGVVRTALNLPANKTLIGKKVTLYGSLESYFGIPGLKNVSYYIMPDGTTGGAKPVIIDFNVPEMSISDLRAQWTGSVKTITDKKKIVGVVITDLVGGNSTSLKNLTISSIDNSAGIIIRLVANGTYNLGDKIEITLEGLELNHYGQAIQLNNVPNSRIQKIGSGTIIPKITTIANIKANYANYESILVTVNGTITSPNGLWGGSQHQSNTLTNGSDNIALFVSSYSAFKSTAIPTGEKSITGIVGQNTTVLSSPVYQLIVRNLSDIK